MCLMYILNVNQVFLLFYNCGYGSFLFVQNFTLFSAALICC